VPFNGKSSDCNAITFGDKNTKNVTSIMPAPNQTGTGHNVSHAQVPTT